MKATNADDPRSRPAAPGQSGGGSGGGSGVLSDDALLDLVQRQTLRFFWDHAHPASGLARDRLAPGVDGPDDPASVGGSGFGIMAILAGVERGWVPREQALSRLLLMTAFLEQASNYHGVFPHWLHGGTGRTIPFSRKDDGGDLVETAYLIMGLLCARQYFDRDDPREALLRARIDWIWREVEWTWHSRGGRHVLYWHWSPNSGWSLDVEIRGWNECLIVYVLAASAPHYAIDADVYHRGWAQSRTFINRRLHYGIELPLGPDGGGPLFFAHYSFMGLDPRGLKDRYADYWEQNVRHTLINYEHCVRNPHGYKGYGPDCWGLTAGDSDAGYGPHAPDNDLGVIAPTAALPSMPYAPEPAMRALRHFYFDLGDRIWGECGFVDAFNETTGWRSRAHVAIDQGPIVVMIENHRSGLLWRLLMSCPEIQAGLSRLGFESPWLA